MGQTGAAGVVPNYGDGHYRWKIKNNENKLTISVSCGSALCCVLFSFLRFSPSLGRCSLLFDGTFFAFFPIRPIPVLRTTRCGEKIRSEWLRLGIVGKSRQPRIPRKVRNRACEVRSGALQKSLGKLW